MKLLCPDGEIRNVFKEHVKERFCGHVTSSTVADADPKEFNEAKTEFRISRKCDHEFVYDTEMYMYDARTCAICGKGMGLI